MKQEAELVKRFNEIIKSSFAIAAKVTKVNDNHTIECEAEGIQYFNVRLKALVDTKEDCLYIIPKIGSDVIIGRYQFSESDRFVVSYSEIERFKLKINNSVYDITEKSVDIINESVTIGNKDKSEKAVKGETLNELLKDLMKHISAMNTALLSFAATQAEVSANIPLLSPLTSGYTKLNADVMSETPKINQITGKIDRHLAENVKVS